MVNSAPLFMGRLMSELTSTSFAALNLSDDLLKALEILKFETPSPVQAETIPVFLAGRDLIAQAQTGTGKTAAFGLPILQTLNTSLPSTQVLVIAPTRELAIQVASQIEALSTHKKGVTFAVLCGGQDYSRQLKQLREGAQIVVGTPGRILDHMERGTLKLAHLTTFVIDEADEMLRMGFIEDVEMMLSKLPEKRQIALFSATMPTRIRQIANSYLKDPVSIQIRSETATIELVEQRFLFASAPQKPDALIRILALEAFQAVIVFVRTKVFSEDVAEILQKNGFRAVAIHGDITQALRERIISQFRQGAIDILVATDVAARGLDVDRVTHVINYDVPHDCETYVHRIGRTGRAGRGGVAILFVTPRESRILTTIERHTRQRIEKVIIPNDYMIQTAKEKRFIADIAVRLQHEALPSHRNIMETFLKAHPDVNPIDLAASLALLLNKDKPWKTEIPQQQIKIATRSAKESYEPSFASSKHSRGGEKKPLREEAQTAQQTLYRIDVGRVHGVKPGNIVGAIANEAGLQSRHITGLKIHDDYSTVRLPKGMPKESFLGLNKAWVCGRQLKLTAINS